MSAVTDSTEDSLLILFYFYYSYLTLGLCWILGPVVFYIVLTQSKTIGNFKWLILNHTFWCFCLENLIGIVKPVLLGKHDYS